jgi:hypothetical protein
MLRLISFCRTNISFTPTLISHQYYNQRGIKLTNLNYAQNYFQTKTEKVKNYDANSVAFPIKHKAKSDL